MGKMSRNGSSLCGSFFWKRKESEFAAYKRCIVDYQYEPSESGFHLNVGSVGAC